MTPNSDKTTARLLWLDAARTIALIGMAIYHFTYDLAMFGYVAPETPVTSGFAVFARLVAGSFLALAGFSLYLAHGRRIRWRGFLRRLALLLAAALVITLGTYYAMPDSYIFFGILHSIALCSVLGLAFLRVPVWGLLPVAALILLLPHFTRFELLDAPLLRFLGLGTTQPWTVDFEPVFPWFGVFLAGMALARLAQGTALLRPQTDRVWLRNLGWPGRHSLWVYLAHQPILISLIWLYAKATGGL